MKLTLAGGLPTTPLTGVWYRAVDPLYWKQALSSAHTKASISRFNPGTMLPPTQRFPTIYLADSPSVALHEIRALLGSAFSPAGAVPNPHVGPTMMLNVQVILRDVVDLTDVTTAQTPLGTNAQELTGDWLGYQWRSPATPVSAPTGVAPTQELGLTLARTGVEGFLAISAPVPTRRTLVVFPHNLRAGSSLTVSDRPGNVIQRIP